MKYGELLEAIAAGSTVVTANNRLARTLRHEYDQQQQAAGATAWATPAIIAWQPWLKNLWTESRLRQGAAHDRVLLDDAATDLLWQQSIAAVERDRPVVSPGQFARASRQAWKLVNDWDARTATEWSAAGLSADQQAFLRWSGEFRNRCGKGGWVDPDTLTGLVTADIVAGLFDDLPDILFAGFDDWLPARAALRTALAERGVGVSNAAGATSPGRCFASPAPDAATELLSAARWARDCLEQDPGQRIGVIVPDLATRPAEVRNAFLDIFTPRWRIAGVAAGLPLNISYGQPLADVPVVSAALLICRLCDDRVAFADLSLLLRSPWLAAAATERAGRATVDIELRNTVRIEFALRDALSLCRRYAPRCAEILEDLIAAGKERRRRPARDWAHLLTDTLEKTGWPGDAPLDSQTWQAQKSWNEVVAAFAASGVVQDKIFRTDAVGQLAQLAQQKLFQPEGTPEGVQVMGMLEAAGMRFDQLWICGMARELWPPSTRPEPLVPLNLQRRLGMPGNSAAAVLDYSALLTARMLASAPELVVSWPTELDGEPLLPSALLANSLDAAVPAIRAWPLWNEQLLAAGATACLADDPPPPLQTDAPVHGGVRVLNKQAVSPLNAFIETRLGAFEIYPPPVGIDPMTRGNLTHKALEEFYGAVPDQAALLKLSPDERGAALEQSLQKAIATLPLLRDALMQELVRLETVQQLRRLHAFIELDMQRPDFSVTEREELHEVRIGPVALRVKLDRLDTLADGSRIVIDYKTGKVDRQSWNPARPRDLQLPLYVATRVPDAAAISFAQLSAFDTKYDGVGNDATGIAGIRSPGTKTRVQVRYQYPQSDAVIDSWDELRAAWTAVLEKLAGEFAAGDFRLDPRNPDSARGQFAVLSRIYDSGIGLFEDDA